MHCTAQWSEKPFCNVVKNRPQNVIKSSQTVIHALLEHIDGKLNVLTLKAAKVIEIVAVC